MYAACSVSVAIVDFGRNCIHMQWLFRRTVSLHSIVFQSVVQCFIRNHVGVPVRFQFFVAIAYLILTTV